MADVIFPAENILYDEFGAADNARTQAEAFAAEGDATHVADPDPHPTYLLAAEAAQEYAPAVAGGYLTPVVGDGRYDALGDAQSALTTAQAYTDAGIAGVVPLTMRGAAGGVATLNAMGQIPSDQLPPLAISQPFVVADQAARLALDAQRGDTALQSDTGGWWILTTDDPTIPVNWRQLTPPGIVTSVNGHAGPAINLTAADVGAASINDARLTDARVPLQHSATHAPGAGDSINAYYVSKAGGDTIAASGTGVVPLALRGAVGQTANLQEWQDSTGAVLARVRSTGDFDVHPGNASAVLTLGDSTIQKQFGAGFTFGSGIGNLAYLGVGMTVSGSPKLGVTTGSDANVGIVVRAFSPTQTANLQEWQNNVAGVLGYVKSDGTVTAPYLKALNGQAPLNVAILEVRSSTPAAPLAVMRGAVSQTGDLQQWQNSAGGVSAKVDNNGGIYGQTFYGGGVSGSIAGAPLSIAGVVATNPVAVIRGAASQSADLQQWQNSAASVLAKLDSNGSLTATGITSSGTGQFGGGNFGSTTVSITTPNATSVGAIVRGVAGQSADFQQWQNNTGAVLAKVTSDGSVLSGTGFGPASGVGANIAFGAWGSGEVSVNTKGITNVGIGIRGVSGQTADLQQWQDNTGTVLAKVTSGGDFNNVGHAIYSNYFGNSFLANSMGYLVASSATYTPLVLRAATGQSVDLQQWQNSLGGTVARITNLGHLGINALATAAMIATVPDTASTTGIVVKAAVGQTADMQQWQDSSGNILSAVNSDGRLGVVPVTSQIALTVRNTGTGRQAQFTSADGLTSTWIDNNALLRTTVGVAALIPWIAKGAASQSADLTQWQDSAGNVLSRVTSGGGHYLQSVPATNTTMASPQPLVFASAYWNGAASATEFFQIHAARMGSQPGAAGAYRMTFGPSSNPDSNKVSIAGDGSHSVAIGDAFAQVSQAGQLYVTPNAANRVGVVVRGAASQTSDLQHWQDSAANVLSAVNASGNMRIVSPGYGSSLSIGTPSAGQVNAIVRAIASQTADLQQWQDSGGGVLAFVSAAGQINAGTVGANSLRARGGSADRIFLNSGTVAATVQNTLGATAVPLVAQGFAGQSNDLQQWQDSAGTSLAKITNAGGIVLGATTTGHMSLVPGTFPTMLYMDPTNSSAAQLIFSGTAAANNGSTFYDIGPSGSFNIRGAMNDSSRIRMSIAGNGQVQIGGSGAADNPSITPLAVRGVTAQTADLQQWQGAAGTAIARITAVGGIVANAGGPTSTADGSYDFDLSGNSVNAFRLKQGNGSRTMTINNAGMAFSTTGTFGSANWGGVGELEVVNELATRVGLLVKGIASQTADLQQWQSSAGTVLAKVGAAGAAQFAAAHINTAGLGATLDVVTAGAAVVPIIARGAAGQTADMQEWQNSAGTVLAMQKPNGEYEQTVAAVAASDAGGGTGGIVLKAPNGTRYRVTVSNAGAVLATAA